MESVVIFFIIIGVFLAHRVKDEFPYFSPCFLSFSLSLLSSEKLGFTTPFLRKGLLYLAIAAIFLIIWMILEPQSREEKNKENSTSKNLE